MGGHGRPCRLGLAGHDGRDDALMVGEDVLAHGADRRQMLVEMAVHCFPPHGPERFERFAQHRIFGGFGHRHVQRPVAFGRPQILARFHPHAGENVREPRPAGRADLLAGQRRRFRFQQPAHGHDLDGGAAHFRQAFAARLRLAYEGAHAHAHLHQSRHFERYQRLAYRRPRHAQACRQVAFGGQLHARRHGALQDLLADLVGDLDIEFAVGNDLKLHRRRWPP